jgi:glycine betaine catabolism B
MKKEILEQIQGYSEIKNEIEVLKKYPVQRSAQQGQVEQIINRLHPKTLNLRLSEIWQETASTTSLRFVSEDRYLPPFQAGQYINIFVEINGIRTSRPYSISSQPNQTGYYDITVRRIEEGFVSNYLIDETKIGDIFQSTAPAGQFHYNSLFHGDDLVFIAGGSGITPFMSMIREVADKDLQRKIHLIYGSRTEDDIVFKSELEERSSRHHNLTVSTVISEPSEGYDGVTGFITADLIKELTGSIKDKTFYVCGPEAMYSFVLDELNKLGVPKRQVRVEVFGPPSDVTKQPAWPESVKEDTMFNISIKNGPTLQAKAGEPLMNSLERFKITLETSCRSGECSLCRTKLLSGKIFHPNGVKLRKSDRTFGYIHPCMAFPLEDLELLL